MPENLQTVSEEVFSEARMRPVRWLCAWTGAKGCFQGSVSRIMTHPIITVTDNETLRRSASIPEPDHKGFVLCSVGVYATARE